MYISEHDDDRVTVYVAGGLGSAMAVLVARRIQSRIPVLIEHEERLRSGLGRVGPGQSSLPPVLIEHEEGLHEVLVELPGRSLLVGMYVHIYIYIYVRQIYKGRLAEDGDRMSTLMVRF